MECERQDLLDWEEELDWDTLLDEMAADVATVQRTRETSQVIGTSTS